MKLDFVRGLSRRTKALWSASLIVLLVGLATFGYLVKTGRLGKKADANSRVVTVSGKFVDISINQGVPNALIAIQPVSGSSATPTVATTTRTLADGSYSARVTVNLADKAQSTIIVQPQQPGYSETPILVSINQTGSTTIAQPGTASSTLATTANNNTASSVTANISLSPVQVDAPSTRAPNAASTPCKTDKSEWGFPAHDGDYTGITTLNSVLFCIASGTNYNPGDIINASILIKFLAQRTGTTVPTIYVLSGSRDNLTEADTAIVIDVADLKDLAILTSLYGGIVDWHNGQVAAADATGCTPGNNRRWCQSSQLNGFKQAFLILRQKNVLSGYAATNEMAFFMKIFAAQNTPNSFADMTKSTSIVDLRQDISDALLGSYQHYFGTPDSRINLPTDRGGQNALVFADDFAASKSKVLQYFPGNSAATWTYDQVLNGLYMNTGIVSVRLVDSSGASISGKDINISGTIGTRDTTGNAVLSYVPVSKDSVTVSGFPASTTFALTSGDTAINGTSIDVIDGSNPILTIKVTVGIPATVTTGNAQPLGSTGETLNATFTTPAGVSLDNAGFYYSTDKNLSSSTKVAFAAIAPDKTGLKGSFFTNFPLPDFAPLKPGTTYYFRAYALDNTGNPEITAKNISQFTTPAAAPTVTTQPATLVGVISAGKRTAVLNAGLTMNGATISTKYFKFGTSSTNLNNTATASTGSATTFSATIGLTSGLSVGTQYFYQACVTTSSAPSTPICGSDIAQFTISSVASPTVTTADINQASITTTGMAAQGKYLNPGNVNITKKGFYYSTNRADLNKSTILSIPTNDQGSPFNGTFSGLTPGQTYFFQAYVSDGSHFFYGNIQTFITKAVVAPTVRTGETSSFTITATGATFTGGVTDTGGGTLNRRGFQWGFAGSDMISGDTYDDQSAPSAPFKAYAFTKSTNTPLIPNTNYWVMAYAKNSVGMIGYGSKVAFTTAKVTPPVVTTGQTNAISRIGTGTTAKATLNGSVDDHAGATVVSYWFRYGLATNNMNSTISAQPTGNYSGYKRFFSAVLGGSISTLTLGKTYYVQAYVTYDNGAEADAQDTPTASFQTPGVNAPAIKSMSSMDSTIVTTPTLTSDMEILSAAFDNGGETPTQIGFKYSDTLISAPDMSLSYPKKADGALSADQSQFSATLSGLKPNTKYYYFAYAENSAGLRMSQQVQNFTTLSDAKAPTLDKATIDNITTTSAMFHSNIITDGSGTVVKETIKERGFWYYEKGGKPIQTFDGAPGPYPLGRYSKGPNQANSLKSGTQYCVYAYAISSPDTKTGYGLPETCFTTLGTPSQPPTIVSQLAPVVTTVSPGATTGTSPKLQGGFTVPSTDSKDRATQWGFKYGTGDSTVETSITKGGLSFGGNFNSTDPGMSPDTLKLKAGTQYWFYAFATNLSGTGKGTTYIFNTTGSTVTPPSPVVPPTVMTENLSPADISATSAMLYGDIIYSGGLDATIYGIGFLSGSIMADTTHPITSPTSWVGTSRTRFTTIFSGLTPNTTYWVEAYADNGPNSTTDRGLGIPPVSFTTPASGRTPEAAPTVVTDSAVQIDGVSASGLSAYLSGRIVSDGGSPVIEEGFTYGVCGGKSTTTFNKTGAITSAFSKTPIDLVKDSIYCVQAYATNSAGKTGYGVLINTRPLVCKAPTVSTITPPTNITAKSIVPLGSVDSTGSSLIQIRGFQWGLAASNPYPATYDSGSFGTGPYYKFPGIADLTPGTTYQIRAYAVNFCGGISYGLWEPFTTPPVVAATVPTVADTGATQVGLSGATFTSSVTGDGGGTITKVGFLYGDNITGTSKEISNTTGVGKTAFSASPATMALGAIYWIQAYAENSAGRGYGKMLTNFQLTCTLPTVNMTKLQNISSTSVRPTGVVFFPGPFSPTSTGVSRWGFQYEPTSPAGTWSDATYKETSDAGTFVTNPYSKYPDIPNLTPSKNYLIRAFVQSTCGTSYSSPSTFTTQAK